MWEYEASFFFFYLKKLTAIIWKHVTVFCLSENNKMKVFFLDHHRQFYVLFDILLAMKVPIFNPTTKLCLTDFSNHRKQLFGTTLDLFESLDIQHVSSDTDV